MKLSELRQKAETLPQTPGVYIMHNADGDVIYVGKAKKLQNRVSQYFTRFESHTLKTQKMVSKVCDFEVINAPTELDALLLENTLIKKYKPKYNILLKDDKGYPYIRLSGGSYPTFSVEGKKDENGDYFGPYGGRGTANAALREINELFKFPVCGKKFPRDIGKDRPCLRYHLNKCVGVCTGDVSLKEYNGLVGQAVQLLEGKGLSLERELKKQMEEASEALEFEKAAALRDKMRALSKLRQSNIVCAASADYDAIGFAARGQRGCVAALSFKDGNLIGKRIVFFDGADEQDAPRDTESFLHQYYPLIGVCPREIYLPCETESPETTEQLLSGIRHGKVKLSVPQRGEKLKMVGLASQNALSELDLMEKREQYSRKSLSELAELIGMEIPERIEAFDISNTAGADAVASMTVFADGKPLKRAYKRFKIKLAVPGDDCASIAEVVGRRLDRAIAGDEGFLPLPSLFLMDGGEMQVAAARSQLEKRKIDIPVFGMVKDDKHRTRGLVTPEGAEIGLTGKPAVFAFIGRIQEETHRFAIDYHHTLHVNRTKKSELDDIPGVGEKRKQALLKAFGSVKGIKNASREALARVVPDSVAEKIVGHYERERE